MENVVPMFNEESLAIRNEIAHQHGYAPEACRVRIVRRDPASYPVKVQFKGPKSDDLFVREDWLMFGFVPCVRWKKEG